MISTYRKLAPQRSIDIVLKTRRTQTSYVQRNLSSISQASLYGTPTPNPIATKFINPSTFNPPHNRIINKSIQKKPYHQSRQYCSKHSSFLSSFHHYPSQMCYSADGASA